MVPGLMAMVSEYQRRNQELVKAIKKRDKEILDYRGSYGPPSRSMCLHTNTHMCMYIKHMTINVVFYFIIEHLETSAFDDKTFLNEMITSKVMSIKLLHGFSKSSLLYYELLVLVMSTDGTVKPIKSDHSSNKGHM